MTTKPNSEQPHYLVNSLEILPPNAPPKSTPQCQYTLLSPPQVVFKGAAEFLEVNRRLELIINTKTIFPIPIHMRDGSLTLKGVRTIHTSDRSKVTYEVIPENLCLEISPTFLYVIAYFYFSKYPKDIAVFVGIPSLDQLLALSGVNPDHIRDTAMFLLQQEEQNELLRPKEIEDTPTSA